MTAAPGKFAAGALATARTLLHGQTFAGARRSHYHVVRVGWMSDAPKVTVVWIQDDNGPKSVTNDAERVVAELHAAIPNCRVIYLDSDRNWDELRHKNGEFIGFRPARHMEPPR